MSGGRAGATGERVLLLVEEMPRAEWDKLRAETLAYVDELRDSGRLISAEPLQSARTAVADAIAARK